MNYPSTFVSSRAHFLGRCRFFLAACFFAAPAVTWAADPTISGLPATQTIFEDMDTGLIPFTIADTDTLVGVTVTAVAGLNAALIDTIEIIDPDPILPDTGDRQIRVTPVADGFGSARIDVTVSDGTGSITASLDLTVTSLNDAPIFTAGADPTVLEDSGPQTVSGWATGIGPGPVTATDESAQTLTFVVTNYSNPTLFDGGVAIDESTGDLTFTPALHQNGTATITVELQDNGGDLDGGSDTSGPVDFDIVVTAVNDAPTFTPGADPAATVSEDSGLQTVANWATDILPGPSTATDESAQTLTFVVTSYSNPTLFDGGVAIDESTGDLTFTPALHQNGTATITVELQDDGLGSDTSAPVEFDIIVTPVNDAPIITLGADPTVLEDSGPQTVVGWATDILPGPDTATDEAGQTVTLVVTNISIPGLFDGGVAIDESTGDLTFTPAEDQNGTATITVELRDDGGDLDGGSDTSQLEFDIIVTAVNDAPTFTPGPDINTSEPESYPSEQSGVRTFAGWATDMLPGPLTATDESSQTLSFVVTSDDPGMFASGFGPAIDGVTGDLTFTLAPHQAGPVNLTVKLMDNGLRANGGDDDSATYDIDLYVTPTPDDPSLSGAFSLGDTDVNPIPDNSGPVSIFSTVSIADPDDGEPDPETVTVLVSLSESSEAFGGFDGRDNPFTISGRPADVTAELQGIQFEPKPNSQFNNSSYSVAIEMVMAGTFDNPSSPVTVNRSIYLIPVNDTPSVDVDLSPTSVTDTVVEIRPFTLASIVDPDPFDTSFTLGVSISTSAYGVLFPTTPSYTGTFEQLVTQINSLAFRPIEDSADAPKNVVVTFTVTDEAGATGTSTKTLQILSENSEPNILPSSSVEVAIDDDETVQPFNLPGKQVRIQDLDNGGNQEVTVSLALDIADKGTLTPAGPLQGGAVEAYASTTAPTTVTVTDHGLLSGDTIVISGADTTAYNGVHTITVLTVDTFTIPVTYINDSASDTGLWGLTPATATRLLQAVEFTPRNGRVPDLSTESAIITITVTDTVGASRSKTVKVIVTGRNGQPEILIPTIDNPRKVSPGSPLPFAGFVIEDDDDPPEVTVRISLDNPAKGFFKAPLPGTFAEETAGSKIYVMTGTPANVTTALAALEFEVEPDFLFPADAPGGTTFTITAEDSASNLATATLAIVLEDASRNFLVTHTADDLTEGSLRYAVSQADNGDFITFALEEYDSIIRLDSSRDPIKLRRNVSVRGPGADLLTISGDSEGDGTPDMGIFEVMASVSIEGLTLADGFASTGGAIYVSESGRLSMRYCQIVDSVALQWGGAIDVVGGSLTMENCLVRGNSTDLALGLGGGGISIFTDLACSFLNTTFSGNSQESTSGIGGGAIYVENVTPATLLPIDVIHCTFAQNEDWAFSGSSIHGNVFGTRIQPQNSIFADGQEINLEVSAAADVVSRGGNISDDNTRTIILRAGIPELITLLDGPDDRVNQTDTGLASELSVSFGATATYSIDASSPAVGNARYSIAAIDQRGVVRDSDPDAGALEYGVSARIIINEIRHDPAPAFVEFYVPENSLQNFLMDGLHLWVDGTERHVFATATIAPGFGIIVSDDDTLTAGGTAVVEPSIIPLSLAERGLLELKDADERIIARATYTAVIADLAAPASNLDFDDNSVTLAPQFMGSAYLPHSMVLPPPLGGATPLDDPGLDPTVNTSSPGSDTGLTDFGAPNSKPLAVADTIAVSEDELLTLKVLDNDYDANGAWDRLIITDIGLVPASGGTDTALTSNEDAAITVNFSGVPSFGTTVTYDPRVSTGPTGLQSLPAGLEVTDVFYYTIQDVDAATGIPKAPSLPSEAKISITVLGMNDVPEPDPDDFTTQEDEVIRIMADAILAGSTTTAFDTDVDYSPIPAIAGVSLLVNDSDPDADDTNASLKVVGVVGQVNAIIAFDGTVGESPVTVESPAHGLTNGDIVLISGYGGHPSYNDFHVVTPVEDEPGKFTIPVAYVDNDATKGIWAILNDDNRLSTTSALDAEVKLEIRSDRVETNVVYNPQVSPTLDALGIIHGTTIPEEVTDTFYYAVEDSHGAVSLAQVSVRILGVNDAPVVVNDPGSVLELDPFVNGSTLADVIAALEVDYALGNPESPGLADARTAYTNADGTTIVELPNIWITDEDTPLDIVAADLLGNDSDVDLIDAPTLSIVAVSSPSAELALISLVGTTVTYDPTGSGILDALSREEFLVDTFEITVSDNSGTTPITRTSLVAVIVVGTNLTPVAADDTAATFEDTVLVLNAIDVLGNDSDDDTDAHDPDDRLVLVPLVDGTTDAPGATVDISVDGITYDPTESDFLDALAQGDTFDDSFIYTVMDGSFIFAMDDYFKVESDNSNMVLEVLANDRNLTGTGSPLTIIAVGERNRGGEAIIDATGTAIIYTPQTNFVGDEVFTYTVTDADGNTDRALVKVSAIVNQLNGNLQANNDRFTVAKSQSPTLNVLANDNVLPASSGSLTIENVTQPTPENGTIIQSGNTLTYVPSAAYAGAYPYTESFTYEISGGGVARATATVNLQIVDLEGKLPLRNDTFSVPAGNSSNLLDVLANDNILPSTDDGLTVLSVGTPGHGIAEANEAGDGILYTPAAGFLGEDTFTYDAIDGFGSSGTATVVVKVGSLTTNIDIFAVPYDDPATIVDNTLETQLDVLANDRVLGEDLSILKITNVVLASGSPDLGSIRYDGTGTFLYFDPDESAEGETSFIYTIEDGATGAATRTAIGTVTLVIVKSSITANSDFFSVLTDSEDNELNVLTNDSAIPALPASRSLAVLSVGTGLDAPNRGGTVALNETATGLIYTPAPDFSGEEIFTYTLTDSRRTDIAQVVVNVTAGALNANDDAYTVYYETTGTPAVPRNFTLPVLTNDRVLPDFGQTLSITGVGIDDGFIANAPDMMGLVEISADDSELIYTPQDDPTLYPPDNTYSERFTYVLSDGTARRAEGVINVEVRLRAGIRTIETNDDFFTVQGASLGNVLNVLANDAVKPASTSGWTITGISATSHGGAVSSSGQTIVYSPQPTFVGVESFTYDITDGSGGTGVATVNVRVGDLPVAYDQFVALSDGSTSLFDVLVNDAIRPSIPFGNTDPLDDFILLDARDSDQGGTLNVVGDLVEYTPIPPALISFPYEESFVYDLIDDAGGIVSGMAYVTVHEAGSDRTTATVTITVTGVNDAPVIDTSAAVTESITDKETALPFSTVTFVDVDTSIITVTVALNDPESGTLLNLGAFSESAPRSRLYTFIGSPAGATSAIQALLFVPRENYLTVPETAMFGFTITADDGFVPTPVVDTSIAVNVTAENDAPVIQGTVSDQTVYHLGSIHPFAAVSVTDVDDQAMQPLVVTLVVDEPTHGALISNVGFVDLGGGVFTFGGTAAEVTAALRDLLFVPDIGGRLTPDLSAPPESERTEFTITVDDGFALPVVDSNTSVITLLGLITQQLSTDGDAADSLGSATAASKDIVVVGAPDHDDKGNSSGAVYAYARDQGGAGQWGQVAKFLAIDGGNTAGDQFGYAVAIGYDTTIVVGAPFAGSGGAIYVFEPDGTGTGWLPGVKITGPGASNGDNFGTAVAIYGDRLVVGARLDGDSGNDSGAVYEFERMLGTWTQVGGKLRSDDIAAGDEFGSSLSLGAFSLLVGSPMDDDNGSGSGAAYLFDRDVADNWIQTKKILPITGTGTSDGAAADQFGFAVALNGDTALIGTPFEDDNGNDSGAAFIYQRDEGGTDNWGFVTKLLAEQIQNNDRFGYSVSIDRDLAIVAAPYAGDDNSSKFGSVAVFGRNEGGTDAWGQLEVIDPSDPVNNDEFGYSVSIAAGVTVVGSRQDDDNGNDAGAVYIYELRPNNAPEVGMGIPDQWAANGLLFDFTIPFDAFGDPDADELLWIDATLFGGGPLPVWLSFDTISATFTGTPTIVDVGTVEVEVTVTDYDGEMASTVFKIEVLALPPTLFDPYSSDLPILWLGTTSSAPAGAAFNPESVYLSVYSSALTGSTVLRYEYDGSISDSGLVLETSVDLMNWAPAGEWISSIGAERTKGPPAVLFQLKKIAAESNDDIRFYRVTGAQAR